MLAHTTRTSSYFRKARKVQAPFRSFQRGLAYQVSDFIDPKLAQRITQKDIEFYRKNGYVVVENALNAKQIEIWQKFVDKSVASRNNDHRMPTKGQEDTTNVNFEYYLNVFTQRVNLWQTDADMKELVLKSGKVIGQIACILEGIKGIRLWHDQALVKEPWANPTSLHLDVPYWSFNSVHAISAWFALDDATLQNGCLYWMPGSHKLVESKFQKSGQFDEIKIDQNMSDIFNAHPELVKSEVVPTPMKIGSMSFHSGMLIHGAGPNMTPYRRRAMTFGMMPDGSTFNGKQNILTNEQFKAMKIGQPFNDNAQNPLLYP